MGSLIHVVWFREGRVYVTFLPIGVLCIRNAAKNIDHLLLYCPVSVYGYKCSGKQI